MNAAGRAGSPADRLGDVQDLIGYMQDLRVVKQAADEGRCTDTAMREFKLPKHEGWGNYAAALPMNIERYCYVNNGN